MAFRQMRRVQLKRGQQKLNPVLRPIALYTIERAHDLIAKPPHPRVKPEGMLWRIMRCSKAIAYVERPPAQGVFGDISLFGDRHGHATGTSSGQFRSSGWRLSEFAGRFRRSGGLRAGLRARPALPGVELQLPD
jgi:hypothetical protein